MAVAKRQEGKSRRKQSRGRSEDRSEDLDRTALLRKPSLHRAGPGGEELLLSLPRDGVLISSRLWIDVPSCLEDGFPCYLLNKIEL